MIDELGDQHNLPPGDGPVSLIYDFLRDRDPVLVIVLIGSTPDAYYPKELFRRTKKEWSAISDHYDKDIQRLKSYQRFSNNVIVYKTNHERMDYPADENMPELVFERSLVRQTIKGGNKLVSPGVSVWYGEEENRDERVTSHDDYILEEDIPIIVQVYNLLGIELGERQWTAFTSATDQRTREAIVVRRSIKFE